MEQLRYIIADGGLLVLAIPVGRDLVVWNAHRVYGAQRLSLLLRDWTIERVLGLSEDMLKDYVVTAPQPLFVLKNERPQRAANFSDPTDAVWTKLDLCKNTSCYFFKNTPKREQDRTCSHNPPLVSHEHLVADTSIKKPRAARGVRCCGALPAGARLYLGSIDRCTATGLATCRRHKRLDDNQASKVRSGGRPSAVLSAHDTVDGRFVFIVGGRECGTNIAVVNGRPSSSSGSGQHCVSAPPHLVLDALLNGVDAR